MYGSATLSHLKVSRDKHPISYKKHALKQVATKA